jgi:hypothetical protein
MTKWPGPKPSDWLCGIESNSKIKLDKLYSIKELVVVFGRHRTTISQAIDFWTDKLIGTIEEFKIYDVVQKEKHVYVNRKYSGNFLIRLSFLCNVYISKNYKLEGKKNN